MGRPEPRNDAEDGANDGGDRYRKRKDPAKIKRTNKKKTLNTLDNVVATTVPAWRCNEGLACGAVFVTMAAGRGI